MSAVQERLPHHKTITRRRLKECLQQCLKQYIALGWLGQIPTACQRSGKHIDDGAVHRQK
ncbi:MAG: hypothetical protein WBA57_13010 [Elainellaceae cyanobacterium]